MAPGMAVFWQHFKAERGTLVAWAAIMAVLSAWLAAMYPSVAARVDLPQWVAVFPAWLKAMIGTVPTWPTMKGWIQTELLSYLHLVLAYFAVGTAAGIYTREIDRGTAEFLFALPLPRWRIVLSRLGSVLLQSAALHAAVYVGIQVTVVALGHPADAGSYLRGLLMGYGVNVAVVGFALWWSSYFSDYSRAVLSGMLVVVGVYAANVASHSWRWLTWFPRLNPLGYYNLYQALWGQAFPWGDLGAAVAFGAAFVALALIHIERREISP